MWNLWDMLINGRLPHKSTFFGRKLSALFKWLSIGQFSAQRVQLEVLSIIESHRELILMRCDPRITSYQEPQQSHAGSTFTTPRHWDEPTAMFRGTSTTLLAITTPASVEHGFVGKGSPTSSASASSTQFCLMALVAIGFIAFAYLFVSTFSVRDQNLVYQETNGFFYLAEENPINRALEQVVAKEITTDEHNSSVVTPTTLPTLPAPPNPPTSPTRPYVRPVAKMATGYASERVAAIIAKMHADSRMREEMEDEDGKYVSDFFGENFEQRYLEDQAQVKPRKKRLCGMEARLRAREMNRQAQALETQRKEKLRGLTEKRKLEEAERIKEELERARAEGMRRKEEEESVMVEAMEREKEVARVREEKRTNDEEVERVAHEAKTQAENAAKQLREKEMADAESERIRLAERQELQNAADAVQQEEEARARSIRVETEFAALQEENRLSQQRRSEQLEQHRRLGEEETERERQKLAREKEDEEVKARAERVKREEADIAYERTISRWIKEAEEKRQEDENITQREQQRRELFEAQRMASAAVPAFSPVAVPVFTSFNNPVPVYVPPLASAGPIYPGFVPVLEAFSHPVALTLDQETDEITSTDPDVTIPDAESSTTGEEETEEKEEEDEEKKEEEEEEELTSDEEMLLFGHTRKSLLSARPVADFSTLMPLPFDRMLDISRQFLTLTMMPQCIAAGVNEEDLDEDDIIEDLEDDENVQNLVEGVGQFVDGTFVEKLYDGDDQVHWLRCNIETMSRWVSRPTLGSLWDDFFLLAVLKDLQKEISDDFHDKFPNDFTEEVESDWFE